MSASYLICYFQIKNHTFAYRCEAPGSFCCGSHCCVQGLHHDRLWHGWAFWIFFSLLVVFGFSIGLIILTKLKPRSYTFFEEEGHLSENHDRRMAIRAQLSRGYQASQGANALLQSLNNMSSANSRRLNGPSNQERQLLSFWTRQIPFTAWNNLPSTRINMHGVIQPFLHYNVKGLEAENQSAGLSSSLVNENQRKTVQPLANMITRSPSPRSHMNVEGLDGKDEELNKEIGNPTPLERSNLQIKPLVPPYRTQVFYKRGSYLPPRSPIRLDDNETALSSSAVDPIELNQVAQHVFSISNANENMDQAHFDFNLPNTVDQHEANGLQVPSIHVQQFM